VINETVRSRASGGTQAEERAILEREFDRFRLSLDRWKEDFVKQERIREKPRGEVLRFLEQRARLSRFLTSGDLRLILAHSNRQGEWSLDRGFRAKSYADDPVSERLSYIVAELLPAPPAVQ